MVGLPLWAVFSVAFGSPLLALLGVVTAQWFARMSDRELEERSRREETMRWAAELATSGDDDLRQLGRSQLMTLHSSALVGRDERAFVSAAIEAGLPRRDDDLLEPEGRTIAPAADLEGDQ